MRLRSALFLVSSILVASLSVAQDVQVTRQNKTITINAEDYVEVQAEIAILTIEYFSYAPTQDRAYAQNAEIGAKVIAALRKAGLQDDQIQTDSVTIERVEPPQHWTPEMKRDRQFSASQVWLVSVPVTSAEIALNTAMRAGANSVRQIDWSVRNPATLQAAAGKAAIAKAKAIAEQMAAGLNSKLGELVYASNHAPVARMWRGAGRLDASAPPAFAADTGDREPREPKPQPEMKLFPQKVKETATVYAVFAIE